MTALPALVTLLNVLLLLVLTAQVGRARARYEIKAPAVTGHPMFERHVRAHMNTIESTLMFLPTLWVAAYYGNALWVGAAGLAWIAARVWYAVAYVHDPATRGAAFGAATLAWAVLMVMAAFGVIQALIQGT
jgi:glutathione S-transferase